MIIISFFTPEIQKKCFLDHYKLSKWKIFLGISILEKKKIFKHVSFQFIKFWNNPLPKSKSFKASICRSLSTPKVILWLQKSRSRTTSKVWSKFSTSTQQVMDVQELFTKQRTVSRISSSSMSEGHTDTKYFNSCYIEKWL